jgi:glycosyltransferase involved in cell wall biosynthesis
MLPRPNPYMLSCVVPCYNEASHLEAFVQALEKTVALLTPQWEIIIVNDGSKDHSREVALSLLSKNRIRYLEFSRNFGKEAALMAGIDHAKGDCVLLIDGDFQHPLEKVPEMAALWQEGYEMVYGVIVNRANESWAKKLGVKVFYSMLKHTEIPIPQNAGDFRWLDRKVVNALKRLPERNRFMKGLYAWVGFKSIAMPFVPHEREGGQTSFNTRGLSRLALSGITSFSVMPLQVWTVSGAIISMLSVLYGIYVIIKTMVMGNDVSGWPTLTVAIMLFSGIQLFSIGVLGEYIGRIFNEVKQRPLYVLADDIQAEQFSDAQVPHHL